MSGLKTQIEIGADASGVEAGVNRAKRSLAGLGQAATDAGKTGAAGLGQIGTGADTSAKSVERATKSIVSQIQRAQVDIATAGKSMSESLQIKADLKGVDPTVIAPYIAQLRAAEQAQEALLKSQGQMGISAKATAAALRGVPAQMTDIITSLQGGQAPLTVLLQQGGQLKDMFGGAGNAVKAMGGYIGGLVTNPIVLATVAVGALGFAANSAANDAKQLRDTVTLTGGAAGVSAGQLQSMAASVGLNTAALNEFAKSGAVSADSIARVTAEAIRLERLGGPAIAKTVEAYESLKRSPVEASVALNEKTNYLTASIYAQIKSLDERGRHLEAGRLAQDAFAQSQARMADSLEAGLGPVDRAWLSIRQNIEGAWKAVKGFAGSEVPLPDRVTAQKKVVADLQQKVDAPVSAMTNYAGLDQAREQLKIEKDRLFILQSSASVIAGSAAEKAKQNELEKAQVAWRDQVDSTRSNAQKRDIETEAARNRGTAANAPQSDIDRQVALVNQKYDTGASVAAVKQAEDAKLQIIARAQDQINTLRATGQLNEIGQITATTEQTIKAIDVRRNALLAERAIVAGRQDSEREVIALDTQIAALSQERATAQLKGLNEVSVAWYRQKQAIQATYEAMKAEDNMALVNEQIRLDGIAKQVADTFRDQAFALQGVNRQIALEVSLIGATDQARQLGLDKLKIQLDLEKKIAELNRTEFKSIEDRNRAIATATEQASEQAAQASTRITVQYWAGAVTDIKNGLSDGIINGIKSDGVAGAVRGFRDSVVNAFDRLVLRPFIDPIMSNWAQGIASMFGVTPQGSPANGLGGNVSSLSGLSSLYGMGKTAVGAVGSWFGLGGASTVAPTVSYAAPSLSAVTSTGMASGGTAGVAGFAGVPVAGWIAMGMMASASAYDQGFRGNSDDHGTTNPVNWGLNAEDRLIGGPLGLDGRTSAMLSGSALGSWASYAVFGGHTITPGGTALTGTIGASGNSLQRRDDFTEDHRGFLGIGSYTTHNSEYSSAEKGTTDYVDNAVAVVNTSVKRYAAAIGLSAAAVDGFTSQIDVSLSGLDAEHQKAAIDKAIDGFMNDMVSAAFGTQFTGLTKTGETSSQTLQRLAADLTAVNTTLDLLGHAALHVGIDGATAAAGLVDAFGSLDQMQASVAGYYDKFYTDSEKAANGVASLNASFTDLGVAMPATRDEFRKLVDGIDVTTESGQRLVAGLLGLAPAFDAAASASEAATARLASVIADYGTPEEVRSFQVEQIRKSLADGGLNFTTDQIGNATRADFRSTYEQLIAAGDTHRADILLSQAKAFAAITEPAQKTGPTSANVVNSTGGAYTTPAVTSTGLSDWERATQAIVDTMRDLRETLVGSGADSFAKLQAQFAIEIAQAEAGNLAAYQDLPNIAKLLAKSGETNSATALDQSLLTSYIVDALGRVAGVPSSGSTLSVAKGQEIASVSPVQTYSAVSATPAGRTYNAVDTTALVGGDNAAMAAALQAMALRLAAIETNSGRGADAGEKLDRRVSLAMPNTNAIQVNVV